MADIDGRVGARAAGRFRAREWAAVGLGLAVLLILTYPAYTLTSARLFTQPWLDGHSSEFAFYPWDRFIAGRLAAGEIPLWNPFEAGGNPLVANYQSSVFYPLKVLVYLFDALDTYLLLRLGVAGFFMYRFLRFIRLSRAGAGVGTLAFTLCSYFLLFLNLTHVNAEVLIPLMLLTTAAYLRFGGAGRFLAAALSVALITIGGHPEATFYALLLGGGYAVFEAWVSGRGYRRIPRGRRMFGGALVFVAGLLLGAIQWLPFVEYLPHAWHIHAPGVGGIHRDALGIVEFVAPRVRAGGYDFPMGVGSVALLLALHAALGIRRLRVRAVYFAAVAAVFIGLFLGLWPFTELGRLPFVGEAGNIKYPAPIVNASLAVLAAIGHDRLRSRLARGQSLRGLYGVGAGLLLVGVAAPAAAAAFGVPAIDLGACALAGALVLAALAFVRLAARGAISPRILSGALLALCLAALWADHADIWARNEAAHWVKSAGLGGPRGWWAAAVTVAVTALLLVRARRPRPLSGWQACAVAASILVVVLGGHLATARVVVTPPDAQRLLPDPARPPEFVQPMRAENRRLGGGPFRITGEPAALPANQSTVYGLEDVRAFDALYVNRFFQYLNVINGLPDYREVLFPLPAGITQRDAIARLVASKSDWWFFEQTKRTAIRVDRFTHPLVDLLGVRFFLYGPLYSGPILEGEGYRTIYDSHGFRVVASDRAAPRAFLVHSAEVLDSMSAVKARLATPDFDGRRTVLLERPSPVALSGTGAQAAGETVRVVSRGTHHVHIEVEAKAPGMLVVTDNHYPGWEAEIESPGGAAHAAEILACDLAFRGVAVPAGRHVVRMEYRPPAFRWGVWLGLSTLVLLLAAWLAPAACRRLRRPSAGADPGGV